MIPFVAAASAAVPSVDPPLRTGARAPDDAAVVVGVEDYAFLPDVPYASRDAAAVYDWLVYARGVPADRVALFDRGADRDQIAAALRAAGTARGTVWVYFSGHGAASATGERLLLGNDVKAELASLQNRGLPVGEVDALVGGGPARIVKLLDTCYVGVGRGGQDLLPGQRFAVPAAAVAGSARVLEWAAAAPNEASGPFTPAAHGAFTYFALGALRGWADGELDGQRDGAVTVEEAKAYLLRAARAAQIRDQHAVVKGGAAEWVLAEKAPEAAPEDAAFVAIGSSAPAPALTGPVADPPAEAGTVTVLADPKLHGEGDRPPELGGGYQVHGQPNNFFWGSGARFPIPGTGPFAVIHERRELNVGMGVVVLRCPEGELTIVLERRRYRAKLDGVEIVEVDYPGRITWDGQRLKVGSTVVPGVTRPSSIGFDGVVLGQVTLDTRGL